MAATALKKINARVKALAKKYPGKKRVTLQKQAGAEYRAGKLGGVKKSRKKTVRRIKALHAAEGRAIRKLRGVKRRKVSGTLSAGASRGIMGVRSTFQAAAIGAVSVSQHLAHARKKIEQEIGAAEVRKFVTKKKAAKRKIAKRITELKSKFRKLC
jgi:hypothetical protein